MPPTPTPPIPADRGQAHWNRAQHHCTALAVALEDLDDFGGTTRLAAFQRWSPARLGAALATMKAAHQALAVEIARLEARRKHYPARRRLG